jgi:multidrug efflux pump subunit AcrA (membrane-fusion protein)
LCPIFAGGVIRWLVERATGRHEDSEVSAGTLFSSGLIAGGSIAGIAYAVLYGSREYMPTFLRVEDAQESLGRIPALHEGVAGHLVGLGVFVGLRVKETLADRAAVVQTQQADAKARQKQASVPVVTPAPATWRPVVLVTGTLAPYQEADVGFKMPGRLNAVKVKVGDLVKAGALLATIDAAEMGAQSALAATGVRSAELALEMAQDAQRRVDVLFASKAISEAGGVPGSTKVDADRRAEMRELDALQHPGAAARRR